MQGVATVGEGRIVVVALEFEQGELDEQEVRTPSYPQRMRQ